MNKELLQKHITHYQKEKEANPEQFQEDWVERQEHIAKYQGYDEEDLYEYISPLWAMLIWGNKRYARLAEAVGLQRSTQRPRKPRIRKREYQPARFGAGWVLR